jgi:hypothetical protein
MRTAEVIEVAFERTKHVPAPRQPEVLDFVEFPLSRSRSDQEWRKRAFTAAQRCEACSPTDAIYDED